MTRLAEVLAYCLLGLATLIDVRLFAYYQGLSLDTIDALWNLPFMLTWPATLFSVVSLLLFLRLFLSPQKKTSLLIAAVAAGVMAIASMLIFYLTSHYIFMR